MYTNVLCDIVVASKRGRPGTEANIVRCIISTLKLVTQTHYVHHVPYVPYVSVHVPHVPYVPYVNYVHVHAHTCTHASHNYLFKPMVEMQIRTCTYIHVLMRDEKEGRKKEASKVKQTTRQSNTARARQSLFLRKMNCLGWDSNPRHSILGQSTLPLSYQPVHCIICTCIQLTLENADNYV